MPGPLHGVTILDLTQFLAGPYGTQILGDLGAEILKIEAFAGDSSRTMPPHFIAGDSAYFVGTNRNKKSVVIDVRQPVGLQLLRKLIAQSDVLVENFRPGVMQRLGLEEEAVRKRHPALIWCSISGFGQDGPYRDRPAYDMIVQALSGGMSLTGERDGPPVRAGIPLGDLAAGMYGAIGILAALHRRRETGKGDYIDISMLDCQVSMLSYQGSYYLQSGRVPGRQGRGHDAIPTYGCFTARDGRDVAITANTEKMWRSLCAVLGEPALADEARFADMALRLKHRSELEPLLRQLFLQRDADEWATLLGAGGIPVATVNTLDRALNDPQILHRNMVIEITGPQEGQKARVLGNPVQLRDGRSEAPSYPPSKGFDTRQVLMERVGLSSTEVDALVNDGVILDRTTAARL